MKPFAVIASALAALVLAPPASGATLIVDFSNAVGFGAEGSDGNTIITRQLGAGAHVTGLAYDATIETRDDYWLVSQQALFGTSETSLVNLQPGYDAMYTGVGSFSGYYDLADLGLDFTLLDDGILKIEFYDSWNQDAEAFGRWIEGRFTITYDPASGVPEPASWALMILGFGAVGAMTRRRRTHATVCLV